MKGISVSRRHLLSCILAAALNYTSTAAPVVIATIVDLQFNSLPSSQGWTYDSSGTHATAPEASLFNVSGTALNQTTFGTGYASYTPGHAIYRYSIDSNSIAGHGLFELIWKASVSAYESSRPDIRVAPFLLSVQLHGDYFAIGIKPDELGVQVGSATWVYLTPSGFDGTVSHEYRTLIDTVDNTWELFMDGSRIASGATFQFGTQEMTLGDSTGTGNANGQTTQLTLSVLSEAPVIVEASASPSTLWPPNNKMVTVSLSALVEGGRGDTDWKAFGFQCDEECQADDLEFVDDHTVSLRATRLGKGNGRTYTIFLRATDQSGNLSEPVSVEVTVPHDRRKHPR